MAFKILIVDDEVFLREMLKDIFKIAGYDVITAEDGEQGLGKIYSEMPDFVVLDASMPVMDGFEVLKKIREDPKFINLPVVLLTALSGEAEQIKGLTLGADDYITKPFKAPVLLTKVKNILDRKKKSLDVNPLTSLPGNIAIKENVERRIALKEDFTLLYIDLSNFKSFNDKYGFERGDDVIKFTADTLQNVIKNFGTQSDFVGHIGGDDFLALTKSNNSIFLAENFIRDFDSGIGKFYDKSDLEQGFIISKDRYDNIAKFPIIAVSISIINTAMAKIADFAEVSKRAAELKKLAKKKPGSSYVFEKRKFLR